MFARGLSVCFRSLNGPIRLHESRYSVLRKLPPLSKDSPGLAASFQFTLLSDCRKGLTSDIMSQTDIDSNQCTVSREDQQTVSDVTVSREDQQTTSDVATAKSDAVDEEAAGGQTESEANLKRSQESTEVTTDQQKKRKKGDPFEDGGVSQEEKKERLLPYKKKKMAMLMVYSGKGYLGMQRNPGFKTIEEDLLMALEKAGVVTKEHVAQPGTQMGFQRAARTDKGVSAAGQLCSLKMFSDVDDPVEKINDHLPAQIRVLGVKKTTKGFNSKNWCDARTYMYMIPTFAFAPPEVEVTAEYRADDTILPQVRKLLAMYKGTHNFHNFTSQKKPTDMSAKRYIMDFQCGDKFVRRGIEFAVLTVKGQSFMIHQIRKMIGLIIAIMRGFLTSEAVERAFEHDKMDIPKAPGLGLVLDKCHYDGYNKIYGNDGLHVPITWDEYKEEIDKFKEEYVHSTIVETELEENSMMTWMQMLPIHKYNQTEMEDTEETKEIQSSIRHAYVALRMAKQEAKDAKQEVEDAAKQIEDHSAS